MHGCEQYKIQPKIFRKFCPCTLFGIVKKKHNLDTLTQRIICLRILPPDVTISMSHKTHGGLVRSSQHDYDKQLFKQMPNNMTLHCFLLSFMSLPFSSYARMLFYITTLFFSFHPLLPAFTLISYSRDLTVSINFY
jgi:hypothetical protein